jgi:hypothetical protein
VTVLQTAAKADVSAPRLRRPRRRSEWAADGTRRSIPAIVSDLDSTRRHTESQRVGDCSSLVCPRPQAAEWEPTVHDQFAGHCYAEPDSYRDAWVGPAPCRSCGAWWTVISVVRRALQRPSAVGCCRGRCKRAPAITFIGCRGGLHERQV